MCIAEHNFPFAKGLYFRFLCIVFVPLVFFILWKLEQGVAILLSRITGVKVTIPLPLEWKLQNREESPSPLILKILFACWQLPLMGITFYGGYMGLMKVADLFVVPYTRFCYGY